MKLICFYFVKLCIFPWGSVLEMPMGSFCRGKHPNFLKGKISRQEAWKINVDSSMTSVNLIELTSSHCYRFVFTKQNGYLIILVDYRKLSSLRWNLISTWFSFSFINISDFWYRKFFEAKAYKVFFYQISTPTLTSKKINLYKTDQNCKTKKHPNL